MTTAPATVGFEVASGGARLAGEEVGEGPPVVAVHGLSATRRQVLHGSRVLPRAGYRLISYDARGHGASEPAPAGEGYTYPDLVRDLAAVIDARLSGGRAVVAGHSMGAHTAAAYALEHPERVAGLVLIGPAVRGEGPGGEASEHWDRLAAGLERGGTDGFVAAYEPYVDPAWRETVVRFTRARMELHEHPEAVARALREVPRSAPFAGLGQPQRLEVPALVVASHDEADPGHPYAIAEAWAEQMPRATLISEERGASPLAWQGGRLSREIVAFCQRPEVAELLRRDPPHEA